MNRFVFLVAPIVFGLLSTSCRRTSDVMFTIEADGDSAYVYHSRGAFGRLGISAVSDSLFQIHHYLGDSLVDTWTIDAPVYRFECGDLNADSVPEILVGVIRATRYRPQPDKRLYIFKLYKGQYIRPLWMGSRLGLPLDDFCVERDSLPHTVHTWEHRADSTSVEAIYRLQGFGLKFVKYEKGITN
ncbi:MAG: nuclear receptor-binding factor 2 [Bacteroidaceae bacterium]|nr:nuclear receptor-binding factor 2 [Bacteroidaceae bacterium]